MSTINWSEDIDWDDAKLTEGVVNNDTKRTSKNNSDSVERGYDTQNTYPSTPYIYWPMQEEGGPTTKDFGTSSNDGDVDYEIQRGVDGLLGGTCFKFGRKSSVKAGNVNPTTSGGTVSTKTISGDEYRIHKITTVGDTTFDAGSLNTEFDILIVAGGGGTRSNDGSAGAGAGGLVYAENIQLQGTYTVTVGDGGAGADNSGDGQAAPDGENSTFGSKLTAIGGGGGGNKNGGSSDGGSGGGGGQNSGEYGSALQPGTNSLSNGNVVYDAGHRGIYNRNGNTGGGGGGAAEVGGFTGDNSDGGHGIDMSPYFTSDFGENGYFAGGGGGGDNNGGGSLDGGLGGGGDGTHSSSTNDGTDATGGGAGGAGFDHSIGGAGGSGIALIRLKLE